jgi:hypothetical protein
MTQDTYVRVTAVRGKEAELLKKERLRLSQEAERVQGILDDLQQSVKRPGKQPSQDSSNSIMQI